MREILSTLFPTWVFWAGFVFTIAGVIYSIGSNLPWIGFISLVPWLIAALDVALRAKADNKSLKLTLELEQTNHIATQRKLQSISSDHLLRIQELLLRATLEECFESLYTFAAYAARLKKLTKSHFDIREVFVTGEKLYVAARSPADAMEQLREDDPFLLYARRSGLNHQIARLRLHQVNEKEGAIFLEVIHELDKSTVSSLRALAESASARGLKDFGITPELSLEPFADEDMEAVTRTLKTLRNNLIKTK